MPKLPIGKPKPAWVSFGIGILVLILVANLMPIRPQSVKGAYTASTTDADGTTHLGSSSVTDTYSYDTTQDSNEQTQQALGIDPNWKSGVTRKSYGLKFDGTDDMVKISDNSTLEATRPFTFETWLKRDATGESDWLANKYSGDNWYVNIDTTDKVRIGFQTTEIISTGTVGTDWTHIAITVSDAGATTIYINGTSAGTGTLPAPTANGNTLYIGTNHAETQFTDFVIDEYRISNIQRYTSAFAPSRRHNEDPQTMLLLHFDEGEGQLAYDASINANNGQLGSISGSDANDPVWVTGTNAVMDGFDGFKNTSGGKTGAGNITLSEQSSDSSDKSFEMRITGSNGLTYDGTDDYVTLGTDASLNLGGTFTIEAWVKTTDTTGPIVSFRSSTTGTPVIDLMVGYDGVTTNNGSAMAIVRDDASNGSYAAVDSGTTINDNQWHHIALTRNTTGTIELFVDGQSKGTNTSTHADGAITSDLRAVGGELRWQQDSYSSAGNRYLSGTIDELRISTTRHYTQPFTPSRRLVTNGSTVGLWHFEEGTGTTTTADSSGTNNTATIGSSSAGADANDPSWAEGIAVSGSESSSSPWLLPGYAYRQALKVTNNIGSTLDAGYGVEIPGSVTNRATAMLNKQTRPDGKDWRLVYQPSDATRSLTFNGNSSYIKNAGLASTVTGNATIEAWVKTTATSGRVFDTAQSNTYGMNIAVSGTGQLCLDNSGGPSSSVCSGAGYNDGNWHHVATTRNSTTYTFYIDGTQQGTTSGTVPTYTKLWVGARWAAGDNADTFLSGSIDEVRFSNTVRYTGNFTPANTPFISDSHTVVLWHFDEGSGTSFTLDDGSYANHGELTSSPTWNTSGIVSSVREVARSLPNGHVHRFDGSDDYVNIGDVLDFNATQSFTVSAWFLQQATSSGNTERILAKKNSGGASGVGYQLGITSSNTVDARISDGVDEVASVSSAISNQQWYHVAMVIDRVNQKLKLYLDGTLVDQDDIAAVGTLDSTSALRIGHASSSTGFNFDGLIDDARIYSVSLSEQEIDRIYNQSDVPMSNLSGWWPMDEGTGTTINDYSGNSYTGTLTNATPDWIANGGKVLSTTQTQFKLVAPISPSGTDTSYYLYYGNPNELGAPSSFTSGAINIAQSSTGYMTKASPSVTITDLTSHTWMTWVKLDTTPVANAFIVARANGNSSPHIFLIDTSRRIRGFQELSGTDADATSTNTLNLGQWSHVAMTYDDTTKQVQLFIDGSEVTYTTQITGTGSIVSESGYGLALASSSSGARPLNGTFDDARIYNTELTAANIQSVRSNSSTYPKTNLVGHWKFDESTPVSTTATDETGNNHVTLTNFNWNTARRTGNANLVKAATEPSTSNVVTEQETPIYFQWRHVTYPSGVLTQSAWSSRQQIPAVESQLTDASLGNSGIYVRFNPHGRYSRQDYYRIASWAVEAFSTSSTARGRLNRFPDKATIIITDIGIDIIDAQTNKHWMRFSENFNNLAYIEPSSVVAKDGQFYVGLGAIYGLSVIQFDRDTSRNFATSGNGEYKGNIADRNDALSVVTLAGSGINGTSTGDVAVTVMNNKHYVATAMSSAGGVSVVHDATSFGPNNTTGTITDYGSQSWHVFTNVAITSGGEVYGSNNTASQLEKWDNVHTDTGDQTNVAADRTYTTSSTPALRSGVINDISVTEGTSTAESGQNTIALATNTGVEILQEHSTMTSGTLRYYSRGGNSGSSNWSSKQFGGAADFDGGDFINVGTGASLSITGSITLEAWVKPDTLADWGAIVTKQTGATGYYSLVLSSTTGKPALWLNIGGVWAERALSSTALTVGNWYHIAAVYDGSTAAIYVNGTRTDSQSHSGSITASAATPVHIGQGNSFKWDGLIDEVRISNSARYSGATIPVPTAPFSNDVTTVGLWHLNEASGQTASDVSSNANNGTLGATSSASSDDPTWVSPAIAGSSDKATTVAIHKASATSADYFWLGTNGASNDDGALTAVSLTTDKQLKTVTTTAEGLPDLDITSLNLGTGGLALVGTEVGAWNPGLAGYVVDDTAATPATNTTAPLRLDSGTIRLKSGTIRLKGN